MLPYRLGGNDNTAVIEVIDGGTEAVICLSTLIDWPSAE